MRTHKSIFKPSAIVAALSLVYGTSFAALTEDEANLTKPESSISVGIGHQSGERDQFGIYDGVMDNKTMLLLDADIKTRDEASGTWKTLSISNLGLDTREIKAGMEQQGNWGVSLGYNQMVRDMPYIINTGVGGFGTAEQLRNNITPEAGPYNYRLGVERDILSLDFFKNLSPAWNFKANYKHEEKEGNLMGTAYGGGWNFLGVPIDSTTQLFEATLNYTGEKLQVSGGYLGSWYENHKELTCYRISSGDTCWGSDPDPVYTSQPLDNAAHQVFVTGAYAFAPNTKGTFKASYTEATADGPIPTASITGIAKTGSPPSSLDNGINTTLIQLGLTSRPMPKLNIVANVRYHDVDDETPVYLATSTMHTTPQSYTTTSGKLEGTYNLASGYNLIAGIDYSDQERSVQNPAYSTERYVPYRSELEETTYRIQIRKSLSEVLNGSLAYLYSDRNGSAFEPARNANADSIAPLHIADRERDKIRFTLDWSPNDLFNLQFNAETTQDDYGRTDPYGVHEGKSNLVSLDASYQLNANWLLSGWISHGQNKIYQVGIGPGGNGVKDASQKDTGNAVGITLNGKINEKTKLGADLSWSRDKSEVFQTWVNSSGVPQTVTQVPDITSTATRIKLFAQYALKKNADLRVDVIHERWKTDDWTWFYSNGDPFAYGTTTDGTTIITDPKQNATFAGIRYIYKFR